jgi:hypothetical protein
MLRVSSRSVAQSAYWIIQSTQKAGHVLTDAASERSRPEASSEFLGLSTIEGLWIRNPQIVEGGYS